MLRVVYSVSLLLAFTFAAVPARASDSDTYRQLDLLMDVFERIRAEYVEEVGDKEMIEAAINGMLSSLDPHSSYMGPETFKQMQLQTRGQYGGLGIEVTMENGVVKVISPIDETPAARAGVSGGDYITHIDGEQIMGLTLSEAVEKMRGPVNTDITITIVREGVDQPFELVLTRAIIPIKTVRHRVERNTIGYVRISNFNEQTARGVKTAIRDLKAELGDDLSGIVLDLRDNPGGLLDQAIDVSDVFLDRGEIVSTRGRREKDTQRWNAASGDMINGLPIIVLINAYSASASEIVAGAIQDHRRGILIGAQSFGKGTVQTIIPLGANSAMRLTTARYYTPSSRSIQEEGIEPDIEVSLPRARSSSSGPRRERDLRGHLVNGSEADRPEEQDEIAEDAEPIEAPTDEEGNPIDYQLNYALDLLEGLNLFSKKQAAVVVE